MISFPDRMEQPTVLDYQRRLSSSALNDLALTNSRFVELLACNSHKEGDTQYEFSQPLPCNRYPNIAWSHHAGKRHKRAANGQLNARRASANGRVHAGLLGFRHLPDGQGY